MKMTKRLISGIVCAMALALAFTFVPGINAVTAKEVHAESAKKAATNVLKAIKKCNDKKLGKYVTLEESGYFGALQKQMPAVMYDYLKKSNGKMTYKIKKVKVKGNRADVKVEVRTVNSKEFIDNLAEEAGNLLTEAVNGKQLQGSEEELADKIFRDAIAKTKTKMKKVKMTLRFTKTANGWVLMNNPSDDKKLMGLLTADIGQRQEEYSAAMEKQLGKILTILAQQYGMNMTDDQLKQFVDEILKELS